MSFVERVKELQVREKSAPFVEKDYWCTKKQQVVIDCLPELIAAVEAAQAFEEDLADGWKAGRLVDALTALDRKADEK